MTARIAIVSIVFMAGNLFGAQRAITIQSDAAGNPNPGMAGQAIMFTFVASEETAPLTYTWQFGDGTTGTGSTTTHTYSSAGIYLVTAMAADSATNSIMSSFSEVIADQGTLSGTKASGQISNLGTSTDSFTFSGLLSNVPANANPANQTVTLNFNGTVFTFAVNKSGVGKGSGGTMKLAIPKNFSGGDIKYSIALSKTNLYPAFVAGGLIPDPSLKFQVPSIAVSLSYPSSAARQVVKVSTIVGTIFPQLSLRSPRGKLGLGLIWAVSGISP